MRRQNPDADALLKLLIRSAGEEPFRQMHVAPVEEWLNVDLPRIRSRRVDLLGRTAQKRLLHIELQSQNDALMPLRMAEYGLAILRTYGQYPEQLVIYVGKAKLRMRSELRIRGLRCQYRLVDIRELDSAALLASDRLADNLLGVLAGLDDSAGGIRKILQRIAGMKRSRREDAWQELLVTCELRGLEDLAEREKLDMPITFKSNLRRSYKFIAEEYEKGRQKGSREIVREQLEKRFGTLPPSVMRRIRKMTPAETRKLAIAILDAKSLRDLFA